MWMKEWGGRDKGKSPVCGGEESRARIVPCGGCLAGEKRKYYCMCAGLPVSES